MIFFIMVGLNVFFIWVGRFFLFEHYFFSSDVAQCWYIAPFQGLVPGFKFVLFQAIHYYFTNYQLTNYQLTN